MRRGFWRAFEFTHNKGTLMSKTQELISQRDKEFADMIIEAIEKGAKVYEKEWHKTTIPFPHNPSTGTFYKGINGAQLAFKNYFFTHYPTLEYMTFNQIKALNGYVKAGEHAQKVRFVYFLEKKDEEELAKLSQEQRQKYFDECNKLTPNQKKELDEKGEIFIVRAFPVFNVAQCENINLEKLNELKIKNNITEQKFEKLKFSPNPFIEKIFENSGIEFKFGGDEAFYHAKQDFIQLPSRENFKSISGFYSTALHELGHATGHHTRLNRDLSGAFGSQSYALEELRAETYSFIQSFDLGIELNLENHASYLDSWAKTASTQNGKDEIRKAIKDALEINKYVKAQWYPKDMSLDFTKTIQEDKTKNLHHTTIKPKSQESTQASIANKNYSMSR